MTNLERIEELESLILKARHDYYNEQPTVSDDIFDGWIAELDKLNPTSKAITMIGSSIKNTEWPKAKHKISLGSLDKAQTPEEIDKWIRDTFGSKDQSIFVTEKLDGISIELVYEEGVLVQAITRGDGIIGEDITPNVTKMGGVKSKLSTKFTGSLRGEIILKRSNFSKYFPDKSNPRNAASGVSKRLDGVGCEHLDVLFYQAIGDVDLFSEHFQFKYLEELGLSVPNYEAYSEKTLTKFVLDKWNEYQEDLRDKLDYDIDGLVVRVNELEEQLLLGERDMRPKGAIAFKFKSEEAKTKILNIICQVGNSGRITPVAEVEPVKLVGAQVSRASLYNFAYIEELGIDIGSEVTICRSNDVIPRINGVVKSTGKVFQKPKACAACGGVVELQGENLVCINTDICPAQKVGRIKNWINAINILEWGEALIQRLVESGKVNNVADLYKLSATDLSSIERMGEKSAIKCHDLLWLQAKLPLEIFIGGLSIPMVGPLTIKMVMATGIDTLNKLMTATKKDFENIKGMGPIKSLELYNGLKRNKDLIMSLLQCGVSVKDKINGCLTGKSFVFTGKMINKRQTLEQLVLDNGGEVKSQVGKSVNFLVIDDTNSSTTKAVTARKFGTSLISEQDFLKMVSA